MNDPGEKSLTFKKKKTGHSLVTGRALLPPNAQQWRSFLPHLFAVAKIRVQINMWTPLFTTGDRRAITVVQFLLLKN